MQCSRIRHRRPPRANYVNHGNPHVSIRYIITIFTIAPCISLQSFADICNSELQLGSLNDRRHASAELRAITGILSWNKVSIDSVDPLLQGALERMPRSFVGFQRTGLQSYRNQKFRFSKVIDRHLSYKLRNEVTAVPYSAIKRISCPEPSAEADTDGTGSEGVDSVDHDHAYYDSEFASE